MVSLGSLLQLLEVVQRGLVHRIEEAFGLDHSLCWQHGGWEAEHPAQTRHVAQSAYELQAQLGKRQELAHDLFGLRQL
eukprot:CAMPEP_0170114324 /NCGR_PEP_ID=MMETSP0020_2-20130122/10614_1 /TAXON_ID=98059 /ORGANISM="Dinobryon sp., Strain UTEXLB2267" /LENGTH=77 /DNA_ID=CAMNT_0010341245 /DNA_START=125 /DNA_END=355 /DNA_ORIENTATION=-